MPRHFLLFALLICVADLRPAHAQGGSAAVVAAGRQAPSRAPIPDWVESVAIPAPDPTRRDQPIQPLLVNVQARFFAEYHDQFSQFAAVAQTAQGLGPLGNVALPWQPDHQELIIHHVRILRGGTVIDLLAGGRDFQVLRRESNLEQAMIDGVLTATLQAEGLAVGDVLDIAFTIRRRGGGLPLRAESNFMLDPGASARRAFARYIWPDGLALRWRGTGVFQRPATRRTPVGNELTVSITDAQGVAPPVDAPPRFALPQMLQVSEFRDWREISALIAPYYERAATLAPDSPLRARIAQIAAASSDPGARAMAALRLVQDEVRYLALLMGDGNYLPASADETWSRRYGDCKGKSALLLALLRGLGIEAEAMAVNVFTGDGVNEALPQIGAFNHVLVRATIGGRVYWLDGTRSGDRDLESLASSRLGWGLPLRAAGGALEAMPFAPAARPMFETTVTFDGSRGLLGEVPMSGQSVFRGEAAGIMRAQAAQSAEQFRQQMAGRIGSSELLEVTSSYDETSNEFTVRFNGRGNTSWSGSSASSAVVYQFDNSLLQWNPNFERAAGPARDAPFSLARIGHLAITEMIILPNNGVGFTITGGDIDRVVAGVQFRRTITLEGGRAIARTSIRPAQMEIPAAEARAATGALREIAASQAGVRAPAGQLTRSDQRALDRQPTTAAEFNDRGLSELRNNLFDKAMADFVRAAQMAPEWSTPVANQAVVEAHRRNFEESERLAARAEALNANDFVVHQARGIAALNSDRLIQAVAAFTRAIAAAPNNDYNLMRRADVYVRLGEFGEALADYATILARNPADQNALWARTRLLLFRNDHSGALASADTLLATSPAEPGLIAMRARVLRRAGREQEAARGFAAAIGATEARARELGADDATLRQMRAQMLLESGRHGEALSEIGSLIASRPNDASLLNSRCWYRAIANVELEPALADCDGAIRLSPRNSAYLDSRAFVNLRLGRLDAAIADASAALAISPRLAPSLFIRAVARLRRGDRETGQQDIAAARRIDYDIEAGYREWGVTLP